MKYDLKYMSVPLPEDVEKLKYYGDYSGALNYINMMLNNDDVPESLKYRLEIEKDIINMMGLNEYPYSYDEALQMMRKAIDNFVDSELDELTKTGKADWIYVNGKKHYQRRFLQTILKTQPEYAERELVKEDNAMEEIRQKELDDNVILMKKNGERAAEIRIKSSIKVKKEFEKVGELVKVYLPVPKDCMQQSDIQIIDASHKITHLASEDEGQRTVYFETQLKKDEEFWVEYSYKTKQIYRELDFNKSEKCNITSDLEEIGPHVLFTPYLKMLQKEIIGEEKNPIKQARLIFDFVTTKVNYSFVREYFTIENISEYAAVNLKGDCGIQAILFITLCRMSGIPAKWQSGLYVSSVYTGCHDWAQFYVAPYGWVFADLSFAGGAYRRGSIDRWNYYFGNLDIFRMVANSDIQKDFSPSKKELRADPIDNQRGEFEYINEGMPYANLEVSQELISMKII